MTARRLLSASLLLALHTASLPAASLLGDWPTRWKPAEGYEFAFKGLYQYDYNGFSGATTHPSTGAPLLADANAWRRKEFSFNARLPDGWDLSIGYDFTVSGFKTTPSGAGVHGQWLDNFVRYSSKRLGDFRIGQFKTPVGWEETISSGATTFLERALPVQAANMGRRIGADWSYAGVPHWLFQLAYFHGGDLGGDNDGNGPAARIVWTPIRHEPGAKPRERATVLHLGLAYSSEDRDAVTDGRGVVANPAARIRAKPEAGLITTRLVDTGSLAFPGPIKRLGLGAAYIDGPLLLQGEYLRMSASPRGRPAFDGAGYYVQGSWVLTGESRPYGKGTIGNVRPLRDIGAFEVALRYSRLDLDDGPVHGGTQGDWTIGANWYIGQHLKLQANYIRVHSRRQPGGAGEQSVVLDPTVIAARLQLQF